MTDWKKTDYGIPKTWKEIEEERIDAELAKNSASPLPKMALAATLLIAAAAGLVFVLVSVIR
jgi:hypothetical protein